MRTSTANSSETTAANLAQLSLFDPFIFELTDQVVLTFQASDAGDAANTFTRAVATESAYTVGQPSEFKGWRLTLRGIPGEVDAFGAAGPLKTQVPLVKFAADLMVQMVSSSEAAGSGLAGVNPDEDRMRLLQLRKSYQAAAKFLQIAQTKLDTLVQTVRVDNEDRS
jgi:hypothetical protein